MTSFFHGLQVIAVTLLIFNLVALVGVLYDNRKRSRFELFEDDFKNVFPNKKCTKIAAYFELEDGEVLKVEAVRKGYDDPEAKLECTGPYDSCGRDEEDEDASDDGDGL